VSRYTTLWNDSVLKATTENTALKSKDYGDVSARNTTRAPNKPMQKAKTRKAKMPGRR